MALYEKEGVSMTAGCLPMIVPMIVLFGIITVIYYPLTYLARMPDSVVNASIAAVTLPTDEEGNTIEVPNKLPGKQLTGYYKQMRLMMVVEPNQEEVIAKINDLSDDVRKNVSGEEYYNEMIKIRQDFKFFGGTLLENPWDSEKGLKGINILWLIPLFSGLTALASSFLSMIFMNLVTSGDKTAQGCNNYSLMIMMPLFSLFITFTVPGGVGIYWICSNIIAIVQTFILNQIYNPVKIRAQAEANYIEERKRRQEDKKRLADARAREEAEMRESDKKEKELALEKKKEASTPKQPAPSKNPNKIKRRDNADGGQNSEPAYEIDNNGAPYEVDKAEEADFGEPEQPEANADNQ